MDMFFTVAVGTAAFLLGSGVGALKVGRAAELAGLGGDRDRRHRDHPGSASSPSSALGIWTLIVSVMLAMRARAAPAPGVD